MSDLGRERLIRKNSFLTEAARFIDSTTWAREEKQEFFEFVKEQVDKLMVETAPKPRTEKEFLAELELLEAAKEMFAEQIENQIPVLRAKRLIGEIVHQWRFVDRVSKSLKVPDTVLTQRWHDNAKHVVDAIREIVQEALSEGKFRKISIDRPLPLQLEEAKKASKALIQSLTAAIPDAMAGLSQSEEERIHSLRESISIWNQHLVEIPAPLRFIIESLRYAKSGGEFVGR